MDFKFGKPSFLVVSLLLMWSLCLVLADDVPGLGKNHEVMIGRARTTSNSHGSRRPHGLMIPGLTFFLGTIMTMLLVLMVITGNGLIVGVILTMFGGSFLLSRLNVGGGVGVGVGIRPPVAALSVQQTPVNLFHFPSPPVMTSLSSLPVGVQDYPY